MCCDYLIQSHLSVALWVKRNACVTHRLHSTTLVAAIATSSMATMAKTTIWLEPILATKGTIGGIAQSAFVGSAAMSTALPDFARVKHIRVFSRLTMSFQYSKISYVFASKCVCIQVSMHSKYCCPLCNELLLKSQLFAFCITLADLVIVWKLTIRPLKMLFALLDGF